MGNRKLYAIVGLLLLVGAFWYMNGSNPAIIPPECLSIGGTNVGMCCYDINKNLVPCSQPTGGLAVFQGTPGIYYVRPFIKAIDTSPTNKIDARLVSATSSPTNEFGQVFANSSLIGVHKIMDIAGTPGAQQVWIPPTSNLLYIGNMNGTYTVSASVCGNALMPDGITIDPNIPELCQSGSGTFSITKESISFTVGISS
jgi:hypothetical protein